jgi:gliding motility-associated-like protein
MESLHFQMHSGVCKSIFSQKYGTPYMRNFKQLRGLVRPLRILAMKMKRFRGLSIGIFSLLSFAVSAQDCSDPGVLCAEAPALEFSPEGPALSVGCFDVQNSSIFQFTTNSMTDPGTAIISIDAWECDTALTEVFLAVMSFDAFAPCNSGSYSLTDNCEVGVMPFIYETVGLMPDTDYFVVVGSNADTAVNTCNAEISISGTAVDIDACCDGEISLGDPYQLVVIGGTNPIGPENDDYQWGPSSERPLFDDYTSDSPTIFPEETNTYVVSASVGECTVTDFVTVVVGPPITVPNTITPNGDNVNDFWTIGGIARFESATVTVFSRWGQQIFKSIGYKQPWDGTWEGSKLPTATYYYVIEFNSTDVNIEPLTGSITIIH